MRCPICKREILSRPSEAAGGDLPFCSARCKLIDLGRWLDGAYQVPVELTPDDADGAPSDDH